MKDDIETLRVFIGSREESNSHYLDEDAVEDAAALERIVHWQRLRAEDIMTLGEELGRTRAERDSLRKALDDRHAADKKAWSAIMRATGRERGIPPNKEVVAFYVAEVERFGIENASLRTIVSKCADALGNGAAISHDCSIAFMGELPSEIGLHVASLVEDRDTWKEQADSLRAKLERATEAVGKLRDAVFELCEDTENKYANKAVELEGKMGAYARGRIYEAKRIRRTIAELSADAPAQRTQISDGAVRSEP